MNDSYSLFVFIAFFSLVFCERMSNTVNIGRNLPKNTQASGIVYLESEQRVIIADDEGYICTMSIQGTNVNCTRLKILNNDFEDLCLVRSMYKDRGVIYIAIGTSFLFLMIIEY